MSQKYGLRCAEKKKQSLAKSIFFSTVCCPFGNSAPGCRVGKKLTNFQFSGFRSGGTIIPRERIVSSTPFFPSSNEFSISLASPNVQHAQSRTREWKKRTQPDWITVYNARARAPPFIVSKLLASRRKCPFTCIMRARSCKVSGCTRMVGN